MRLRKIIFLFVIISALTLVSWASGNAVKIEVSPYLMAGPTIKHSPAFDKEAVPFDINVKELSPCIGKTLFPSVKWEKENHWPVSLDKSQWCVVASYFYVDRFCKGKFVIDGVKKAGLWIDDISEKAGRDMEIDVGFHSFLLLIRAEQKISIHPFLELSPDSKGARVSFSISKSHPLSHNDYRKFKYIQAMKIAPDENKVAVVIRDWDNEKKRFFYIKIIDLGTGKVVQVIKRNKSVGNPFWSPCSKVLGFTEVGKKGKTNLYFMNVSNGETKKVYTFDGMPSSLKWYGKSGWIYLLLTPHKKHKKVPYDVLTEIYEKKNDGWDRKTQFVRLSIDGKFLERLTAGQWSVREYDILADSRSGLFVRSVSSSKYPYSTNEFYRIDLGTLKVKKIWKKAFDLSSLKLSPKGDGFYFTGSSRFYSSDPAAPINYYDEDLYFFNFSTGKPEDLTSNFNPTLGVDLIYASQKSDTLALTPDGSRVFFLATDGGRAKVYEINSSGKIKDKGLDGRVIWGYQYLPAKKAFLYLAGSMEYPPVLYYRAENGKVTKILDINASLMNELKLGTVEEFDFTDRAGYNIDGWFLHPVNFDPQKKYPLIVFYYGGVIPCGEVFSPELHWFSGQGYAVYVLTPRGAVGYGPQFADEHPCEWGSKSAEDIIEGTKHLLLAKSFINPKAVGAFSGSYGGFLTMSLGMRTDMFAALCSEYGISNIASYWGGGWWGYQYGLAAMPGAYPWNRRDVYVNLSPLFNAEKIKTPLLLMHGLSDVNVPAIESIQMFTALKVLSKKVAFVRFYGENHGMKGKFTNWIAQERILGFWFDRYLKGWSLGWETFVKKNQRR